MAHFTSFYPTSVTYHRTFALPFTFAVFETARVPPYAQFQVALAGSPQIFDVCAGREVRFVVADFVGEELIFFCGKSFQSWFE